MPLQSHATQLSVCSLTRLCEQHFQSVLFFQLFLLGGGRGRVRCFCLGIFEGSCINSIWEVGGPQPLFASPPPIKKTYLSLCVVLTIADFASLWCILDLIGFQIHLLLKFLIKFDRKLYLLKIKCKIFFGGLATVFGVKPFHCKREFRNRVYLQCWQCEQFVYQVVLFSVLLYTEFLM